MDVKVHSHTPGPWHIRNGADFEVYEGGDNPHTVASGELVVAHISRQGGKSDANARLIAAAPEMLELCKRVLRDNERGCLTIDTVQLITDAIAKAEGRA